GVDRQEGSLPGGGRVPLRQELPELGLDPGSLGVRSGYRLGDRDGRSSSDGGVAGLSQAPAVLRQVLQPLPVPEGGDLLRRHHGRGRGLDAVPDPRRELRAGGGGGLRAGGGGGDRRHRRLRR
ncbi:unnamed protein product, partial [Ectocarpus fasciculatus]